MDNKNTQRQQIYLAALLHDIGKFYQRADTGNVNSSEYLTQDIRKLEDFYCPQDRQKNTRSHKHILWTAQFFKDLTILKEILEVENAGTLDQLMRLASIHHNPSGSNISELIIQKADHYSSGADRSMIDEAWADANEETREGFKKVRMRSVFEGIGLRHKTNKTWSTNYKTKLSLCELQLSDTFFKHDDEDAVPDYKKLWNSFFNEIQKLKSSSLRSFAETMLYLLEKYTSRIPASTQHLPDVSLYDHLKTTATFAVCLYDYIQANNNQFPTPDQKPFLLVGGDLSGIQKFIYGIISKGAAKNLKGRSFYLQLLIDNVVYKLIEALDLFDANIVYKSGGGFYLLAPNTDEIKKRIADFEKLISDNLFEFHNTELYLSISYSEFGEEELYFSETKTRTIGDIWNELAQDIGNKKNRKFAHKIKTEYQVFFEPSESGADSKRDAITGEEIKGKACEYEGYNVSEYTLQQLLLGVKLRTLDYRILSSLPITYYNEDGFQTLGLDAYNYFVDKNFFNKTDDISKLKKSADRVRFFSVNRLDFLETLHTGKDNTYGFAFYGGNRYPISETDNGPKTFEELAGVIFADKEKTSRKSASALVRLGILRMDVDNLGTIFRKGLSADKRSFSRYSVLSRSLDYFFTGYLNTIWQNNDAYRQYTQIIYSGGDDLFIVGKWDVLIPMAHEINKKFREWVCHNPDLTLSGGLVFVTPKFPILKAAELAEKEEKNAKLHFYDNIEKNAVSLFGYAFQWDTEFEYLLKLKETIKRYISMDKGLPRGFPTTVFNLMEQAGFYYDQEKNKYRLSNYQVAWLAAYKFKRASQNISNDELEEFLMQWVGQIFTGICNDKNVKNTKYHALQFLAIASRWAGMELR